MTVSVTPSVCPTAFDRAYDAAVAAGWVSPAAFDACVVMLAAGIPAERIETLFRECGRWLQ